MDAQPFPRLFLSLLQASPKGSAADQLGLDQAAEVSYFMDLSSIQDSFRFRARQIGLKMATLLIDEQGGIDKNWLKILNGWFKKGFYVLGPHREGDALIYGHIGACLQKLEGEGEIEGWIRKFSPPLCHKKADEWVRNTLQDPLRPETIKTLQPFHIRRAVLAAWLTFLRQTTGSCFATAPAIYIQQKHPVRLIKDLYDLLSTGRLKRIFGGKEYVVPMSLNAGSADLQKPLDSTSFANLSFSPGIIAALEAGGIVPMEMSFFQKAEICRSFLKERELPRNAEELLKDLLLEAIGLTEEDLEDEAHLARIQMTPLLAKQTAVYYQKPSERAQKAADWKKRVARARGAFLAQTECALLRVWEYTIASFCDVKLDFVRWNLYIGLGLQPEQAEGVGAFLLGQIEEQLQQCNREIGHLQAEYERAIGSARATEAMIFNSSNDAHRQRLRGELMGQVNSANTLLEARDRMVAKAEAIAGFFPSLMQQYYEKLQEYFQELFDPALIFLDESHLYDDSQAGFRLVYKHGRADASQWTPIYTGEEYVHSLRDFFSAVESALLIPEPIDPNFASQISTALIQFIQRPEFLSSALKRSKENGRRSPWDYFSGGTMESLVQTYCSKEVPWTETQVIPHSEEELLQFLLTQKDSHTEPLLIHSPTHAFLFYPAYLPSDSLSLVRKAKEAVGQWQFDEAMQEHLAHRMSERLPENERALFIHFFRQKPFNETLSSFRIHLTESLQAIKNSEKKSPIRNSVAMVDSLLFENAPLFPLPEAKAALSAVLKRLGAQYSLPKFPFDERIEQIEGTFLGPSELHQAALSIVLEAFQDPISEIDWDLAIAEAFRILGMCYPFPIVFADTNWSGWFFGFIVNPATNALELWRLNRIGLQGFPMSDWKEWLTEKNRSPWILLPKAKEYSAAFS